MIICDILYRCGDNISFKAPKAAVCHAGDYLEVVCNATNTIVNWDVAFVGTNDRIERSVTSTQQVQEIVTSHSTVFIFST